MDLIIFTDLDGSLLDHDDYSFEAARPILAEIRNHGIPLVLVTSKTRSEVAALRQEMGVEDPFIVENGGGLFIPSGFRNVSGTQGRTCGGYTVIEFGVPYAKIRDFLVRFGREFSIRGFGDLSVEAVAELTDLPLENAAKAKQREFTEPFLIEPDSDLSAFAELANRHGLKITRGGRFYHLIGANQDKGIAVRTCREIFSRTTSQGAVTVGIGDSENDLPMLAAVDIPVLIPRPDGSSPDVSLPKLITARFPGSKGWAEAVGRILHGQS